MFARECFRSLELLRVCAGALVRAGGGRQLRDRQNSLVVFADDEHDTGRFMQTNSPLMCMLTRKHTIYAYTHAPSRSRLSPFAQTHIAHTYIHVRVSPIGRLSAPTHPHLLFRSSTCPTHKL